MNDNQAARRSCVASNHSWRLQAAALRQHAQKPHLADDRQATLLREAEAADHQADFWLAGAMEAL